jgi:hypothetical protein
MPVKWYLQFLLAHAVQVSERPDGVGDVLRIRLPVGELTQGYQKSVWQRYIELGKGPKHVGELLRIHAGSGGLHGDGEPRYERGFTALQQR